MDDKPIRDLNGKFLKGCNGRRGTKHSEETKQKLRLAKLGKKGKKRTAEQKLKISHENSGRWKGDKASIDTFHKYIRKYNPPPELCEFCKVNPPYDLANITGIYNRDIANYKYLCRKCHIRLDGIPYLNLKQYQHLRP